MDAQLGDDLVLIDGDTRPPSAGTSCSRQPATVSAVARRLSWLS